MFIFKLSFVTKWGLSCDTINVFLSFVTIWVFEFCPSFVTIWVSEFCHNMSKMLSQFDFFGENSLLLKKTVCCFKKLLEKMCLSKKLAKISYLVKKNVFGWKSLFVREKKIMLKKSFGEEIFLAEKVFFYLFFIF